MLLQHHFAPLTKIIGSWPYKSNQYFKASQFFAPELICKSESNSLQEKKMGLPHNLSGIYQTIQVGVQPRKKVITHPTGLFHLKETCVLAAGLQWFSKTFQR